MLNRKAETKILQLLQDGPMTGLEMVRRGIGRGTIYVHLSRLEDKGLVERIPERRYQLTTKGIQHTGG